MKLRKHSVEDFFGVPNPRMMSTACLANVMPHALASLVVGSLRLFQPAEELGRPAEPAWALALSWGFPSKSAWYLF